MVQCTFLSILITCAENIGWKSPKQTWQFEALDVSCTQLVLNVTSMLEQIRVILSE